MSKTKKYKSNEVYFTSDLHLFHAKAIDFCNRPFNDVEEMHKAIIDNWNMRVGADDTVFILGDLHFGKPNKVAPIMNSLNGYKHLILGNHDKGNALNGNLKDCFESINQLLRIDVDCQRLVLCHYAMKVWEGSHKGAWQLYGHSHGTLDRDNSSFSMDVGVDCNNYKPVSYSDIQKEMMGKTFCPVDCHENENWRTLTV